MAKKIEKEPKPLKSAPAKEPKAKKAEVVSDKCGACNGSGLERPTFTNSPLCSVCNGTGIIS